MSTGSSAPGMPRLAAVSGSRVKVTSTPCPISQMSTAPRQKMSQSGANPNCAAQTIVIGTSGIATPIATTRTASNAEKRTVIRRVIALTIPGLRRPGPGAFPGHDAICSRLTPEGP